MFKGLGKLKSAAKAKKSDRQDDGTTTPGGKSNRSTFKEKDKPKPRNMSKKKKPLSTSMGEIFQSSEEGSRANSQTVFEDSSDVHRLKGKRISKACEEAVNHAVSDFFECAWTACAERFFITTAPLTVSFELRNTWLRVVEAEWQDPDMREKPNVDPKHNRIFKPDEPPLPLAFDSWSRGAIEPLPRYRRESVLDPFLRDLDTIGHLPLPSLNPSRATTPTEDEMEEIVELIPDGLDESKEETMMEETAEEGEQVPENALTVAEKKTESAENIPEKDKWNFDLDREPTFSYNPDSETTTSVEVSSLAQLASDAKFLQESQLSGGHGSGKKHIHTVLSIRHPVLVESVTDVDYSSPTSRGKSARRRSTKSMNNDNNERRKFSPSQCGGRVGSGVFRLPQETTSEALLERKNIQDNAKVDGPRIVDQHVEDRVRVREGTLKVTKKGRASQRLVEEDELEVQPLFEERTPRTMGRESTYRFQLEGIRRPSYAESHLGRGSNLDQTASDISKRFLKRRLVNLHGRFKRQAMRSLAARAKQRATISTRMSASDLLTADWSKTSLMSSSKSNRANRTKNNRTEKNPSKTSYSTSNLNASGTGSTNSSAAKGTSSEPQLNRFAKKANQQHAQKEQQLQKQQPRQLQKPHPQQQHPQLQRPHLQQQHPQMQKQHPQQQHPQLQKQHSQQLQKQHPQQQHPQQWQKQHPQLIQKQHSQQLLKHQQQQLPQASAITVHKAISNFSFKTMGNVQPSLGGEYRNMAGKFDDMKRTPTQLQSRYESIKKFSNDGNQLSGKTIDEPLAPTPSDCLSATCSKHSNSPIR